VDGGGYSTRKIRAERFEVENRALPLLDRVSCTRHEQPLPVSRGEKRGEKDAATRQGNERNGGKCSIDPAFARISNTQ
jgi:hypothetical protein